MPEIPQYERNRGVGSTAEVANRHLILETKGYDEPAEVKSAAAQRWVTAVNADGQFGIWQYALVRSATGVAAAIDAAVVRR